MKIDPWSTTTYQDYARLRTEFGINEFTEDLWEDLPHPHKLLKRGVVFGHRDFDVIHDAIKKKQPWRILTGLMPSGRMHLGHKIVIDQVIYYQSIGAEIVIAVADIEAYSTRGYSLKETKRFALEEYLPNYVALGLKPDKCRIYFQSQQQSVKDLAYLLGRKVNWSQMLATYGFTGETNMAHVFSPMVQTGDILHVQLPEYGGVCPTLVPVGVDQDPHIRLCRDIAQAHRLYSVIMTKDERVGVFIKSDYEVAALLDAAEEKLEELGFNKFERITDYKALYVDDAQEKDIAQINQALAHLEPSFDGYGFLQPASTYHRFMTGLTGEKMSSSKPETAIFLTDTPKEAAKKIQSAKTGGGTTIQEHKKHGGKPEECVIYELFLYHLIDDDKELQSIFTDCKAGDRVCGECKKQAVALIQDFLQDLMEKRKAVTQDTIDEFLSV